MNRYRRTLLVTLIASFGMQFCYAQSSHQTSPQAATRTYAQNYKDMVLATCIATSYKQDGIAAVDAGSSVSALLEWGYYDLEKAPGAIKALVDEYLARDYHNPLVEAEVKGVRFDLLKCLDLYHSEALNEQVDQLVIQPNHTYRQDNR